MVTQSGLQQYTNQEKIIQVAAHNLEIASELRDGELQFTHVFVDLERICNLACHGCFKLMNTDRTQMKLDYEEVKNIVDFGQEREAGVIVIAGAGEPTLDSDFRKIIEYIYGMRLSSVVFTNGSTLDKELSNFLFDNNASPVVKKFAVDYSKQDFLIGVQGMSERMQKGLDTLINVKKQRNKEGKPTSEIAVECYVSTENLSDIPDVLRYCRKNDLIPYIEAFITTGQMAEASRFVPSQHELNLLFQQLARIDNEEYGISTILRTGARVYSGESCMKGKTGFAVHTNGAVLECVSGRYIFGNIRDQNLKDIFDLKKPKISDYYSSIQCLGCQCSESYNQL